MKLLLLASAGGAIGAATRYAISQAFAAKGWTEFPWATLFINVTGSALMGVVAGIFLFKTTLTPELRVFLATGILGGYTTFSAFSLETFQLAERGQILHAGLYVLASVVLSIAGLGLGLATAKWLLP